jgi:DNA-binding NarL/FixJ family response regulator
MRKDEGSNPRGSQWPIIRILVVDDFETWRRYVCSLLQKHGQYDVIGEVADGLEAVHKAQELQPDVILLDINLPSLNGIQAARRIRECAPKTKILFVSENTSEDIAEEALRTGAQGYVVKEDARRELLIAIATILRGEKFLGRRFSTSRDSDIP